MYPVSSAFIAAMKSPSQKYEISGTIGNEEFSNENILAGSFSITNQCSDNTELTLGSVYIGELDATFINLDINRYAWYGAEITVYFGPAGFEPIPMGVFTVAEAEWTAAGTVIKAYDNMSKFDKAWSSTQYQGTPYQILGFACALCNVELGMTQAQVEALANGDRLIALYSENDVETWRDVISWLAITLGGFATIDRNGALVIRQYTQTVVDTIGDSLRYVGAAFSDYETRYTGLSYADVEDEATHYFNVTPDDGLTYTVGVNPFMQYGLRETRDAMAEEILQALQGVRYVPFSATSTSNPAYDLGDVIRFSGGLADATKVSCVTKFTFNFNSGFSMTGVGKNPALASAKSKVDKNISGLLSKVDANKTSIYSYTNISAVSIAEDTETGLLALSFATVSSEAKVDLWMEANLNITLSDATAVGTIHYYLNNNEIEYSPMQVWSDDGMHILGLHYFIGNLTADTRYEWLATIEIDGGSATAAIDNIHAVLRGDGLAGSDGRWDGTIEVSDDIGVTYIRMPYRPLSDRVNAVSLLAPTPIGLSQTVASYSIAMEINPITETKTIIAPMMIFSPWTNQDKVTTTATVTSGVGWVGSGDATQGTAATIVTEEITGVTGITIYGSGGLYTTQTRFLISPDSGVTWYGMSNSTWTQDYYMNPFELFGITTAQWAMMDSTVIKVFLGAGDTLYIINAYGANDDVESMNYYVMDNDEGNKTYNANYVELDTDFHMITDFEANSAAMSIDDGYLQKLTIAVSGFETVNDLTISGGLGDNNLLTDAQLNLNNWIVGNTTGWTRTITYANGNNAISMNGNSSYERFYLSMPVTAGSTYKFSCYFRTVNGYSAYNSYGRALVVMPNTYNVATESSSPYRQSSKLAASNTFTNSASATYTEYSCQFTAASTTTVYLVIDLCDMYDGVVANFDIKDLRFEEV